MGTTSTYGWHYPESTDPPNGAAQMQQLANDIEGTLSSMDTRLSNPPVVQLVCNNNNQQFPSSTSQNVLYSAALIDTHGGWNGTDSYVFKQAGIYIVGGSFTWGAEDDGYRQIKAAINGTNVRGSQGSFNPIYNVHVCPTWTVAQPVRVSVGDALTIIAWQSTGSTIAATSSVSSGLEFQPTLYAYKIAD